MSEQTLTGNFQWTHTYTDSDKHQVLVSDTLTSLTAVQGATSIKLGDSIKQLPQNALCGSTSLLSVDCNNVSSFGRSTFSRCTNLQSFKSLSVTNLVDQQFSYCQQLTSIDAPNLTSFETDCLMYCYALSGIHIDNDTCESLPVNGVPDRVVFNKGQLSGNLVQLFVTGKIAECSSVTLDRVTTVLNPGENRATNNVDSAQYASLEELHLPNLLSANRLIMFTASLTCIDIPKCEWIGSNCFESNRDLPSIELPSIKYIGSMAFYGCNKLSTIDLSQVEEVPILQSSNAFGNIYSTYVIKVPDTLYDEFCAANQWRNISSHIEPVVFNYLKLTSKQAGSTVALNTNGNPATLHLEMSRNGTTWTPFVVNYTYNIGGVGDYIMLRAPEGQPNTNGTAQSSTNYHQFTMTGNVEASDSIMALYSSSGTTAMTQSGFYKLFNGCSALKKAPKLEATLAANCYAYLFAETGLTTAPELAQTTLAMGCYQHMFEGCASLTAAPKLPATTLASYCYNSMFKDCTNITKAPALNAESADVGCYSNMFNGCTSLDEITTMIGSDYLTTDYTENWLVNVASTGTFYSSNPDFDTSIARSGTTVPVGWAIEIKRHLMFTARQAGSTVRIEKRSGGELDLQYKINDGQWTQYSSSRPTLTLSNVGDTVQFKGDNAKFGSRSSITANGNVFRLTGEFDSSGNIMSLLDSTLDQTDVPEDALAGIFESCSQLKSAPDMPFKTVQASGCLDMFKNSGISGEVVVEAETIGNDGLRGMFSNCSSLEKATFNMNPVHGCPWGLENCTSLTAIHMPNANSWGANANSFTLGITGTGTFYCNQTLPENHGSSYIPNNFIVSRIY